MDEVRAPNRHIPTHQIHVCIDNWSLSFLSLRNAHSSGSPPRARRRAGPGMGGSTRSSMSALTRTMISPRTGTCLIDPPEAQPNATPPSWACRKPMAHVEVCLTYGLVTPHVPTYMPQWLCGALLGILRSVSWLSPAMLWYQGGGEGLVVRAAALRRRGAGVTRGRLVGPASRRGIGHGLTASDLIIE